MLFRNAHELSSCIKCESNELPHRSYKMIINKHKASSRYLLENTFTLDGLIGIWNAMFIYYYLISILWVVSVNVCQKTNRNCCIIILRTLVGVRVRLTCKIFSSLKHAQISTYFIFWSNRATTSCLDKSEVKLEKDCLVMESERLIEVSSHHFSESGSKPQWALIKK